MKRRESLKGLLIGTVAGATAMTGCKTDKQIKETIYKDLPDYGRTPEEKDWDKKILEAEPFFNKHEMETLSILCDIILPRKGDHPSATEVKVPEFIEFIVKDMPDNQLPLRGGLMWLDTETNRRYNKQFSSCSKQERITVIEDIAYPDPDLQKPAMSPGISFFNRLRNLTLTGYYTTKEGFKDLGYLGNTPNVWDGVPQEVLSEHDVQYDPEWIAKCVDQSKRDIIAQWDEKMNLIS